LTDAQIVRGVGRTTAMPLEGIGCPREGRVALVLIDPSGATVLPPGEGPIAEWIFSVRSAATGGTFPLTLRVDEARNGPLVVQLAVADAGQVVIRDQGTTPVATATPTTASTATRTQSVVTPTPTVTPHATGEGDCCAVHEGVGCNDAPCEDCVCDLDALCCIESWDQQCVDEANAECAASCICEVAGGCCVEHEDTVGCDNRTCQNCVCTIDQACCVEGWDAACADAAANECAARCSECAVIDCCVALEQLGCPTDATCEDCVCGVDSFCCDELWDDGCAEIAGSDCQTECACVQESSCPCDCSGDGVVTVNELTLAVNIALGNTRLDNCPAADANGGGMVGVADLIQGVIVLLNGCPNVTPRATGLCDLQPGTCEGGERDGQDCTASAQCVGGTCSTSGNISKIELNVAALPVPLSYPLQGQIQLNRGEISDSQATMECAIKSIDPINIPSIGCLCISPATEPCTPPGVIECGGGALLGVDLLSDGNIGSCENNEACSTSCDTYCSVVGGTRQTSGCVGFCSGSTAQQCNTDADCNETDNGACNGPDPVGFTANICQCQCVNTVAGEAARPGDFQCQLGVTLVVEDGTPCDGTDVAIAVGDACIPVTTSSASSLITNANFNPPGCPGGGPPCHLPTEGQILNLGTPVACTAYDEGDSVSGLTGVGVVNLFGSALGDIATELFAVCK
jgi:hypothetical protein